MSAFKSSFKRAMSHVYPEGVDSPSQGVDLLRVFTMGYIEAYVAIGRTVLIEVVLAEVAFTKERNLKELPIDWRWW